MKSNDCLNLQKHVFFSTANLKIGVFKKFVR